MGLFNGLYKNYGMPKEKVLEWQRIVTGNNTDKVMLSKQQLLNSTKIIIDERRRIVRDSAKLVNTTLTPGVFLDRFDTLIQESQKIAYLENFISDSHLMEEKIKDVLSQKSIVEISFIQRYYGSVMESVGTLKTTKAKEKRIIKFFEIMDGYIPRMSSESIEYLNKLRNHHFD